MKQLSVLKGWFHRQSNSWPLPPAHLWIAYTLLIFYTISHHEPWIDEADPWIHLRDAGWDDIRYYFARSGHPPLWHSVLFPFASLGFPAATLSYINAIIASAAAGLLIYYGRFPLWFKAVMLGSFAFGYQYAIVARGYMLLILVFSLIAILYPSRHRRPVLYLTLLGLACNTESYAIIAAVSLACVFVLEALFAGSGNIFRRVEAYIKDTRYLIGTLICFSLFLLCLVALYPTGDTRYGLRSFSFDPAKWIRVVTEAFFPYEADSQLQLALGISPAVFSSIAISALLCAFLSLRSLSLKVSFIACFMWLGFVYNLYYGEIWHFMLCVVFCLIYLWADGERQGRHNLFRKAAIGLLTISMLANLPVTYRYHATDLAQPFAPGKAIAEYIQQKGLEDEIFISRLHNHITEVSLYLPDTTFINIADTSKNGSYLGWGRKIKTSYYRKKISKVVAHSFKRYPDKEIYILSRGKVRLSNKYQQKVIAKRYGFFKQKRILLLRITPSEQESDGASTSSDNKHPILTKQHAMNGESQL